MNRHVLLVLPLMLALAAVSFAGIPGNFHQISAGDKDGKVKYLGIANGSLAFVAKSPHLQKRDERVSYSDRWVVMGTKIKSSTGGGYLAYDPMGKNHKLLLASKSYDDGTDWLIARPKGVFHGKNESRSVDEEWGLVQAASGPLKGWFLDVEVAEEKGEDGKVKVVRRFILSKTPVWNFEVSRMYLHL